MPSKVQPVGLSKPEFGFKLLDMDLAFSMVTLFWLNISPKSPPAVLVTLSSGLLYAVLA